MEIVLIVVVLVALSLTALMWGADSRYDLNDPEWEQHQARQIP